MRVVCISQFDRARRMALDPRIASNEIYPELGVVYTVRGLLHGVTGKGYYLEEIKNPLQYYANGLSELAFDVDFFRPVTDISDLIKLTKVRELEDA